MLSIGGKMGSRVISYFQLALAMSIVGSSVVAGKLMIATLPVMLSSCLRFAIASPVLILLMYYREGFPTLPNRKELLILFLQALTGVFGFSIFLLNGLQHTNAIEAGLVTGTLPAVTAALAMILLNDKLNTWQFLGIGLTAIGACMLNTVGQKVQGSFSGLGVGLIFAAVICEALFTVLGKQVSKRLSPLTIATWMSIFGFVLFFPFALSELFSFDFSQSSVQDWSLVVYFGLVVSVGAFWLFYSGLTKVPAFVAGGFTAFLPLSAVFLSNLILNETIHNLHLIAGSCVIMGIILVSRNKNA